MKDELDFEDYPTLHLHMMVDDYDELCGTREADNPVNKVKEYVEREESLYGIDPQGRFSFCFVD
ncbi:MAG: hypothetical protein R3222_01285 [Balneolaceae bacterium]|nr:hypothetical protein [Balneolaceae bacterium]